MIRGTAYFISQVAAHTYYKKYDFSPQEVAEKLKQGEIHVGKPKLEKGELLQINRDEGRYFIKGRRYSNDSADSTSTV